MPVPGCEHTVSCGSKANALVGARHVGAAEHREVLRSQALEVVAGSTVGVDRLHVDRVTRTGRDVLDLQAQPERPSPTCRRDDR